jgi:hypothetical protein
VNFILFALALLPALLGLISILTLIRVTVGQARFTSTGAYWSHLLTVAIGLPVAVWLFGLAFA